MNATITTAKSKVSIHLGEKLFNPTKKYRSIRKTITNDDKTNKNNQRKGNK